MSESKALSGVEIKSVGEGKVIARFATYNEIDHHDDITRKGAFEDGADVVVSAYNHQSWGNALPVGKGRIRDAADGAYAELQFFLNTQAGRDTFETVKELGSLGQWSYGFDVVEKGRETVDLGDGEQKSVRVLKKVKVHEISPVLLGAGKSTATLAVKSLVEHGMDREAAEDFVKRTFTQSERHHDAESGAAMPDGSFPIEDATDLANAVHLVGHAKDPEAARRHIISRARALGLTDQLPASWRVGKSMTYFYNEETDDIEWWEKAQGGKKPPAKKPGMNKPKPGQNDDDAEDEQDGGADEDEEDSNGNKKPPNRRKKPGQKPSGSSGNSSGKMRMSDQTDEVIASISDLADRAEEIVTLRKSQGKSGISDSLNRQFHELLKQADRIFDLYEEYDDDDDVIERKAEEAQAEFISMYAQFTRDNLSEEL